jgi:ribulose-phosphate 3-epimerase
MKDLKRVKIAVSILDSDFLNLGSEIDKIQDLEVDCLHLDVMDGNFVPQLSIGHPVIRQVRKKTQLFLAAHLMIGNPDEALDSYIECGLDMITVHAETARHLHLCLKKIKGAGIKTCIALNPATPLLMLEDVLDMTDAVLIMSVNPGYGGQEFIRASIGKIKRCRQMLESYRKIDPNKYIDIFVDGGVNDKTYRDVIDAGGSVLILGSYFFKTRDPEAFLKRVRDYPGRLSIV